MMRLARLVLLLTAACSSSQIVGGHCRYQKFHGTCRFVALEHSATRLAMAYYAFDDGQFGVELSIDDERFALFEAHLRAHADLTCAGERIVRGTCVPMLGKVEIPSFDGATLRR
jgi:hypothetical protein